jgi:uncharacterized phiE125 gp8 family phage protein
MAAILLTPPAIEPLTLADAKLYLRVAHDDDDGLIASLIAAARSHVEGRARRALITQVWRITRDAWPPDGRFVLPLAPAIEVVAARVYDAGGVAHETDTQAFVLEAGAAPGVIAFSPWFVPPPGRAAGGIELDVTFGYGDAAIGVPAPLIQAMRLLLAHWYENRGVVATKDDGAALPMPMGVDALLAPFRGLTL